MDKIILSPLNQIYNSKGSIFHVIKKSDDQFNGFGEAYFSFINKGEIKGWKKHKKMTLNLVVPFGEIEFTIYNEDNKKFFNTSLSKKNYQRLTIREGLWVAFRGVEENNILLNIANIEHDPSETINKNLNDIKYDWK
jgi:dTDP-4-dehydrorhamnose 3,5-epimerase